MDHIRQTREELNRLLDEVREIEEEHGWSSDSHMCEFVFRSLMSVTPLILWNLN